MAFASVCQWAWLEGASTPGWSLTLWRLSQPAIHKSSLRFRRPVTSSREPGRVRPPEPKAMVCGLGVYRLGGESGAALGRPPVNLRCTGRLPSWSRALPRRVARDAALQPTAAELALQLTAAELVETGVAAA